MKVAGWLSSRMRELPEMQCSGFRQARSKGDQMRKRGRALNFAVTGRFFGL